MQELLRELEGFGKEHSMFNISRECGEFLNQLIKQFKPNNILEVGMSNGYSTIWLASAAKEFETLVTTIENNPEKIKLAKENFKKAELDNINMIQGDALKIIPNLDQEFDFVFIDAVKKDYLKYLKSIKLSKKAIITAHNVISHKDKMKDFLEFVRKNFESRTYEDLDLEVSYNF
ncbi:methyltransferase domain-containing protein [Candidatus Woesearchaeota archaeon]|nr:methyltransferase domain-containing protein [Candidatus Woesearchaeota archaeon]